MNNIKILDITAREILDSRGNPTVSTKVVLSDGGAGSASVPSGASTGSYEAKELRDGDKERFGGKGVLGAVKNVETDIRSCLTALDDVNISVADLAMINLDGTDDKSKLGANATLSVSLALARALADSGKIPLWKYLANPYPDWFFADIPWQNMTNSAQKLPNPMLKCLGRVETLPYNGVWKLYVKLQFIPLSFRNTPCGIWG